MANFIDRKGVANNWQGGKQADYMDGGGGNDTIRGGAGHDRIYGGDGSDQLFGEDGNDDLYGGAGNDVVDGGAGGDDVWGDAGNDTLVGGSGIDALRGGLGADTMTGGSDSWDEFTFTSFADSAAGNADTITDYSVSGGDLLLFVNMDANAGQSGWQVWEYLAGDAPSDEFPANGNGQATIVFDGQFTVITLYNNELNADGSANLDADFQLRLLGAYEPATIQISVLDTASVALHDGLIFA